MIIVGHKDNVELLDLCTNHPLGEAAYAVVIFAGSWIPSACDDAEDCVVVTNTLHINVPLSIGPLAWHALLAHESFTAIRGG